MAKERKPAERVKNFNSLASYHASTAKDGDIDIPMFEGFPIRRVIHAGAPWFSVVDVVAALTDSDNPNSYWGKLKERVAAEAGEWEPLTKCQRLKLPAPDGKMRETDCADIETLNRIVQSIPSPKVEPWKQWLARVGYERLQETVEPSRAIERAIDTYRKMGRDEAWIDDRIGAIEANNEKTDEWKKRDVAGNQYAKLNAEMSKEAFGVTPQEHCAIKNLPPKENRQNHMTRMELQIQRLADTAATEIMVARDTKRFAETRKASIDGAGVAGAARAALEKQTGKPVVSSENFLPPSTTAAAVPPPPKRPTAKAMLKWFYENHTLAAERSPYIDGEYTYPTVEASEALETEFPAATEKMIKKVVEEIDSEGGPWVPNSFLDTLDDEALDEEDHA